MLGWWSAGQRHVYTRETPVESLEDLDGIKIRVIGNPVYLDTFNELGALATGMPYGEVYSALANGTIDAAEGNTSGYRNMKFWEQAPNLSLTGHFFLYKPVLANTKAIESLSTEQRIEFDEIFDAVTELQWDLFDSSFSQDIEELQNNGILVTQPDIEELRVKANPVVDKYAKHFGEELVNRIRSIE